MTTEIQERGLLNRDLMVQHDIIPLLKPGDWVVDGGAALGDHTAAYLKAVGRTGRVFAFEPSPDFFKCLIHNCPRCIPIQRALWHESAQLWLTCERGNAGAGRILTTKPEGECYGPINTVRLDDMNLVRLDFVKLDVEGSEIFALRGMRNTLLKFRPRMVLEVNKPVLAALGFTPRDLYQLLEELGYNHKSIRGEPGCACENCDILCWPK